MLLSLAIPYAILRLRDAGSPKQDPQTGLKAGLYFFSNLALMILLSGFTVIIVDLLLEDQQPQRLFEREGGGRLPGEQPLQPDKSLSPAKRTGWALVLAGFVFFLLHFILVKAATNDRHFPAARR